jgi:LEA14-like dessication related protein
MKTIISTLVLALILFSSCSTYKDVQEPEYRDIRDVRLIKAGLLETTAGVDLIYYNPNDFGIQLTNAKGDIYIDNTYFGRFNLDDKVQVKKHSEFVLPVVFKLDNIGTIKNQRDIYKKKEALVRIEGTARVKKSGFSKEIPIKYESMQNIERFRTFVSK